KHANDIWGARAALALGYEDSQKNRAAYASTWLAKAKGDTVLQEYVLYWRAQINRTMKKNADAFADLKKILTEYPNTANKEHVVFLWPPPAIEMGRAQATIEALNSYAPSNSKPSLLIERARAYQAAGQGARAAKDYQTVFYKAPLSDEAKVAGSALSNL